VDRPRAGVQDRYARSGELSIAYQVLGSGDLDLVVAPGFVSHLEWAWQQPDLRHFLERLASFSRLILFDERGTGLSDPVAAPATLEERVDDLRAVMDAAGAERRAVLGSIHVPTLVLQRRGDHLLSVEVGRYLADHIPGARSVALDGDDHLFFVGDVETPLAEIQEFLTGARPLDPVPERVLATVLFVDVAGSTELLARIGDAAWARTRAEFLGLARRELARYGGREVDVAGDGLFAAFGGRRGRSAARSPSGTPRPVSACTCAPACTPARSNGTTPAGCPGSRCTSAPG
jgi:hypothetical protein